MSKSAAQGYAASEGIGGQGDTLLHPPSAKNCTPAHAGPGRVAFVTATENAPNFASNLLVSYTRSNLCAAIGPPRAGLDPSPASLSLAI